jgi:hypothetical protein
VGRGIAGHLFARPAPSAARPLLTEMKEAAN